MEVKFENDDFKAVIIPQAEAGDNRGLRFLRNDEIWLELLVSGTTLSVSTNLITEENVYDWLWFNGLPMANHFKNPKRIKLYHDDIIEDRLQALIENLDTEDL